MAVKRRRRLRHSRPEFSVNQILTWADTHRRRTGAWPNLNSGPIADALGDTWRKVDNALRYGLRGLPGDSSLAQLLAERRNVRHQGQLPPLQYEQILAWAEAHRRRTGSWPTSASGPIRESPGDNWRGVDQALRVGLRGLPSGSSLAQFLLKERGVRHLQRLPRLTTKQILTWADVYHERTGEWPNRHSGVVADAPGETWKGIAAALALGRRGLPGGSSLARLLAEHREVRNPKRLPRLTLKQVRAWAKAHHQRTGEWPTRTSGPIPEAPGETWSAVQGALVSGCRGFPAGLTLARVLGRPEARPARGNQFPLTIPQILTWADAHRRRNGFWPHPRSGPIKGVKGETWRTVDQALRTNTRGVRFGGTLVQLLTQERGLQSRSYRPTLTERQILVWARAHHERTGTWPNFRSGPLADAPGETWRSVDQALRTGLRGLPGGKSLAGLLAERRGARNRTNLPRLEPKQIVTWAEAHHRRTGTWPTSRTGPVTEAPEETWKGVDIALRGGYRGLPGGTSLARLLAEKRGVRNRTNLPQLDTEQILTWAEAHRRRTGTWPTSASGSISGVPGETWKGIEMALRQGYRGLEGGSSLAHLLDEARRRPGASKRATG